MKLMLTDAGLLNEWIEHKRQSVALRSQQVAAVEASAWGSSWDRIKSAAEGGEFARHGKTAVINCVGMLDYKYDIWAYLFDSSCYLGIINQMQAAAMDSNIEKIILYCDSPGGYTSGVIEAADAVYAARQVKEVVAVVDPSAYSGGYWLASQASRIVAIESGGVGSIGSQIIYRSYYQMMQQMGVNSEVLRSVVSPHKNAGHPEEELSEAGRKSRQESLDFIGEKFVAHVARGRGVSTETVLEKFGQGKTFYAEQAIALGMIDAIGSYASELAEHRQDAGRSGVVSVKHESLDACDIQ